MQAIRISRYGAERARDPWIVREVLGGKKRGASLEGNCKHVVDLDRLCCDPERAADQSHEVDEVRDERGLSARAAMDRVDGASAVLLVSVRAQDRLPEEQRGQRGTQIVRQHRDQSILARILVS